MLLAGIGVYAYPKLFDTVNSRLTRHVETELNTQLEKIGLSGNVDDAKFIEGKGIQISGVQLTCSLGKAIAGIEQAFIHVPVQLPELISSKLKPNAIELSGATIIVTRDSQGHWNIQDILEKIANLGPAGKSPAPVILRNSKIRIVDRSHTPATTIELSNFEFQTHPLEEDPSKFAAAGSVSCFRNGKLSFLYRPDRQGASLRFRVADIPINRTTVKFLPPAVPTKDIRSLFGLIEGSGSLRINQGQFDPSQLSFEGQLQSGAIDHRKSPHLIADCHGPISLKQNSLTAKLTGKLGTTGQHGQFESSLSHQLGSKPIRWTAKGRVEGLGVDRRLANYFGPSIQKFFADFSPKGIVNVDFDFSHDHQGFTRKLDSEVVDMAFNFVKFPYPIQHAKGTANVIDDQVWFDISATEQGQPVGIKGTVKGKGPTAHLAIDFWNDGKLPIDKKLALAVSATPKVAENLFNFRPAGFVKVFGQLRKSPEQRRAILNYDVELIDCQSQHAQFEYPINQINGMVHVRDNRITISDVWGRNNESRVKCDGTWAMDEGLSLHFDAHQVELDQRLATALTPEIRDVWDAIRPSGKAHFVHVDLTSLPNQPVNVVVESILANPESKSESTVAINPYWFPYHVGKLDGRIYVGNGEVRMNIAQGFHNETRISCLGNGDYDTDQWSLTLSDLMVGSLVSDQDLLNAVPGPLRESLAGLDYQGAASGFGTITMRGRCESKPDLRQGQIAQVNFETPDSTANSEFEMDWNVRLDMDRGQFNVGLLAENVFGSVSLAGNYDGDSVRCDGSIALDSVHWQDMQFTNVNGPLWIENERVAVGSMAKSDREDSTPNSLTGNLFGGTIRLDGQSWAEKENRFFVQASVSNINVKRAGQQMAPSLNEVGGTANLAFRVGGGETMESMRGEGLFQLRNANIYELPVVLSMLKMMKTRRRDRSIFDASNADFTISGESISINKIELLGDAISLVGKGEMNMEHDVQMDFYTVAGRNRFHIPILSELAKASSQQILWLKVDGSLENPQVSSELLPGLNESVRQLFQTDTELPPSFERAQSSDRWRR